MHVTIDFVEGLYREIVAGYSDSLSTWLGSSEVHPEP